MMLGECVNIQYIDDYVIGNIRREYYRLTAGRLSDQGSVRIASLVCESCGRHPKFVKAKAKPEIHMCTTLHESLLWRNTYGQELRQGYLMLLFGLRVVAYSCGSDLADSISICWPRYEVK